MATPLTLDELRAKTETAKQRIHRQTYATQEEVQEFFERIPEETIRIAQQEILARVHAGFYDGRVCMRVPYRVLRSLNILATSQSWESYKDRKPFYAECIDSFMQQKVAKVTIKSIVSHIINYPVANETYPIWIELEWY